MCVVLAHRLFESLTAARPPHTGTSFHAEGPGAGAVEPGAGGTKLIVDIKKEAAKGANQKVLKALAGNLVQVGVKGKGVVD